MRDSAPPESTRGIEMSRQVSRLMRAALALAACGPAASSLAAGAGACVVRGEQAVFDRLVVRPRGSPSFTVSITGAPASVQVPQRGPEAAVAIGGALSFQGYARNPWYTIASAVTV